MTSSLSSFAQDKNVNIPKNEKDIPKEKRHSLFYFEKPLK